MMNALVWCTYFKVIVSFQNVCAIRNESQMNFHYVLALDRQFSRTYIHDMSAVKHKKCIATANFHYQIQFFEEFTGLLNFVVLNFALIKRKATP